MKIESYELENFRGIPSAKLNLKKINVLSGPNGTGKSSMLSALRYVLTGNAPDGILRNGAERGSVIAEIGGHTVKRSFGAKTVCSVDGKASTQKDMDRFLEEHTGTPLGNVDLAVSEGFLEAMENNTIGNRLIGTGLIPMSMDLDQMLALFPSLTPLEKAVLRNLFPKMPATFGLPEIEAAHDRVFEMRRDTKKAIEEARIRAKTDGMRDLAAIDADIFRLSEQKAKVDAYAAALVAYNQITATRAELLKKIGEIEEEINNTPVPKLDASEAEGIARSLKYIEDEISSGTRTITVLTSNEKMFQKTLENLSKSTCPISGKLVCSTDKTSVRTEIVEQIQNIKREQATLTENLNKLEVNKKEVIRKREFLEEKLSLARDVKRLFETKEALQKSLPSVPAKPIDPSIIIDPEAINKVISEKTVVLAANAAAEQIKKLEEKAGVMELLLTGILSEKGGIRSEFLSMALSPLQDHCNTRAKVINPNLEMNFAFDAKGRVQISMRTDAAKGFVPVAALSTGEKAIALFLIMDMLNALSGFKVLLLDGLDSLDDNAFNCLLSCVQQKEVIDSYDHIIMATVNHSKLIDALEKTEKTTPDFQLVHL